MGRVLGVLLAVVVLTGLQPFLGPLNTTAHACSDPGPLPQDPVVVEGWVERLTLRPDITNELGASPMWPNDTYVNIAVEVTLREARVLYGRLPQPVTFFDPTSVYRARPYEPDGTVAFVGGGGACGTLDQDETGRYAIAVLQRNPSGLHTVRRTRVEYLEGPFTERAVRLREARLRWIVTLPVAGDAAAAGVARVAMAMLALACTAAGALCLARGWRA